VERALVDVEEPGELAARVRAIVDAEIHPAVVTRETGTLANDEQGRRLAASLVTADGVTGLEGGDETPREWARRGLEDGDHRVDDSGAPRMLPWTVTPGPVRPPAQGRHREPV